MPTDADPIVGNWYQHPDKGQRFEVIAVDEDNDIVEIQYFDGDLEEIDLDTWYSLDLEAAESPEDWTGPLDDIEHDDLGYTETEMGSEDWSRPFKGWKDQQEGWERGEDEEEEEPEDEQGDLSHEEQPWEED